MPKGLSPYTGPFRITEVFGWYTYRLSDGQKWNSCRLKRFLPSSVEWMELSTVQPQEGDVPVQEEEAAHAGEEEAGLEPVAFAVPVELQYPIHDRHAPEWFSTDTQLPQGRGGGRK